MELLLKVINTPQEVNYKESFQFSKNGGTIGRDSNSTWMLSDSQGVISETHAEITYANGNFYLQDISKNGIYYTDSNTQVPPFELVRLDESTLLSIGTFEISVNLVKENTPYKAIDELLNQREIDVSMDDNVTLHKHHDSPVNVILKEKPLDQDILSYVDIIPAEEDPFENTEKDSTVLTEHIAAPTLQVGSKEKPKQPSLEPPHTTEDLFRDILFQKLSLDKSLLNETQASQLILELINTLVVMLEGIENISHNALQIQKELGVETTIKTPINIKKSFHNLAISNSPIDLSQQISKACQQTIHHHTALYQSIQEVDDELSNKMAPKSLKNDFNVQKLSKVPFCKNSKLWNHYESQYSYLNHNDESSFLIRKSLIQKYKKTMGILTLTQKGE